MLIFAGFTDDKVEDGINVLLLLLVRAIEIEDDVEEEDVDDDSTCFLEREGLPLWECLSQYF